MSGLLLMSMFQGDDDKKSTPAQTPSSAPVAVEPEGPTANEQAVAKAEEDEEMKRKKATAAAGSTVLTGSLGSQDESVTGKKTLLGA